MGTATRTPGTLPTHPPMTDPNPAPSGDDDALDHLFCCDNQRAWCGVDISATRECPGDCDEHPDCPLCWLAEPTLTCGCEG